MALLNFKEILELIDRVADKGLGAVEIESSGFKLRVEGKSADPVVATYMHDNLPRAAMPGSAMISAPGPGSLQAPVPEADVEEAGLHIVTSPIVGTFYRAPNPESAPFVNVGDRVSKGQVICIVEAMKLMNEIESDIEGVVAKVFPQNGQPVEYGEKLFAVRTS
ncbi:MAG: acetyl-CoA carboxylase biotin carboxyl carrier protein [Thermoanaerobaculia bacterium]|nr:acetyl-CoA carboxylase biotin carboxyl carrier protein [Thermoanaerobaculia bacterium]